MAITVNDKDLGMVTAYAYALSEGYTGTEEEFAELMASYATVAQEAAQSASNAAGSASGAADSAAAAAGSATDAGNSASDAEGSASDAAQSKTDAAGSAQNAHASADAAAGSASAASGSATSAANSASAAATSETNAASSASAASGSATSAANSASAAAGSAAGAADSATAAAGSANDASGSASAAAGSAAGAADSATAAAGSAAEAKAFAHAVSYEQQTLTDGQKYQARQNIGAISYNEVEHKRFGVSGVGQSSPTLTRLYDAVGMTATHSTDVTEGSSDFDNFAPFNRRKCVGNWTAGTNKAVFNVQAYEGDADYAEDGSMGDYVAVEVEPFYYYDQDGILAVSTYQWPGYKIHPVCVDYDGNIRAKTYLPVYALAQDANGKAVSLPGFYNQRGGYNDLRNYAKTYSNTGAAAFAMIEPSAVWHYEWLLMTIEFATLHMQSIMYGAASMRYAYDKIVAVPGSNKIVVGSVGSNFVVGQTIYIGASYGASVNVRTDYNRITAIDKCDADGTPNASGAYYRFSYDGTDRSSGITVNTTAVASRPWCTGATAGYAPGVSAVKGHTGSPVNNTNGKYPMQYRWRENVYGNQFMTTLDLADLRVADGDSFHLDWYYLADPRLYIPFGNYDKATIQDTSKGWVKLGVSTPVSSYVNGYVKTLGADSRYPHVRVPVLTSGGSDSTYYCDYAHLVDSHEVRCVRRGGYVTHGAAAGPCCFLAYDYVSYASWSYGATLYFLQ